MELADIVVVNKADGALADAAGHAAADYRAALALMRPKVPEWPAEVLLASALNKSGIADIWDAVERHRAALGERLAPLRAGQATRRMWAEVHDSLVEALRPTSLAMTGASSRGLSRGLARGRSTRQAAQR